MPYKNLQDKLNNNKKLNDLYPHRKVIAQWKYRGMKLKPNEDWDSIYLYYITCEDCESCGIELTDDKKITVTRRCLDHDHSTGFIRNVLCHSCNCKREFI